MNRVFKVVWNRITSQWVVTSELGKSGKKSARSEKRMIAQVATIALSGALLTGVAGAAANKPDPGTIENGFNIVEEGDYKAEINSSDIVFYAEDVKDLGNLTLESAYTDAYGTTIFIINNKSDESRKETPNATPIKRKMNKANAYRDEVFKLIGMNTPDAEIGSRADGRIGNDKTTIVLGEGTVVKNIDFGTKSGGLKTLDIEFQDGVANKFHNADNKSAKATAAAGVTNMTLRLSGKEDLKYSVENNKNTLTSTYADTTTTLTDDDVVVLKGEREEDSILGQLKKSKEGGKIVVGRGATINDGVLLTDSLANDFNHKYNLVVESATNVKGKEGEGANATGDKATHISNATSNAGTYRYTGSDNTFAHNVEVQDGATFATKLTSADNEFSFTGDNVEFADNANFILEQGKIKTAEGNKAGQANFIVKAAGTVIHDASKEGGRLDNLTLDGGAIQLTGKTDDPDNWNATPLNIDGDKGLTIKGDSNKIIWDAMPNNGANYDQQKNILDQQEVTSAVLVKSDKEITVEDGATMTLGNSKDAQDITVDLSQEHASTEEYLDSEIKNIPKRKLADYEQDDAIIGEVIGALGSSVNTENIGIASKITELKSTAGTPQIHLKPEKSGENEVNIILSGDGGFNLAGVDKPLVLNNQGNSFTGESVISSGIVQLGEDNTLGKSVDMSVANEATLDLNGKSQKIEENSALTVDVGGALIGEGTLNLESSTATLNFNSNKAETLNPNVIGNGNVNVNLGDTAYGFTFNKNQADGDREDAFKGVLALEKANYQFSENQGKLENATLTLSNESLAVHDVDQVETVGNLKLAGGELKLESGSDQHQIAHPLEVKERLIVSKDSTVTLDEGLIFGTNTTEDYADQEKHMNLLDQQERQDIALINAQKTEQEEGAILTLNNSEGKLDKAIYSDDVNEKVALNEKSKTQTLTDENGTKVGDAIYDFAVIGGSSGLSMSYKLAELAAEKEQAIEINREGASTGELTADLTGEGGFNFNADGDNKIVVGNEESESSYTGDTQISGGVVELGRENALGVEGDVTITDSGRLDLNSKDQIIGNGNKIDVESPAGLTGNGTLTFNDGQGKINLNGQEDGDFTPNLKGEGSLNINHEGSKVNLVGKNRDFSGYVNMEGKNSTLGLHIDEVNKIDTIGTATINANERSNATIDITSSGGGNNSLNAIINGANDTTVNFKPHETLGVGNTVISKDYSAGKTNVIGGGSGLIIKDRELDTSLSLDSDANLIASGSSSITGTVENSGNIYIGSQADRMLGDTDSESFGTLTIDGDYVGNKDSKIHFGGNYAEDDSPTDMLFIKGDASGEGSDLVIENIKGLGAKTDQGILIVDIEGDVSNDFFTLNGGRSVSAGNWIYDFGEDAGKDGKWHLHTVVKTDPNQPGGETDPNQPGGEIDPNQPGGETDPNQPGGETDPNQPGGETDPNQPGGETDPNQPGGETDPNQPGGETDPNQPGGETDPNQPGGETDPNQPGGETDPNQPGGETDPNQPGGETDPNQPGGETDPNQPGGETDPNQPGGETDPNQPGGETDPNQPGGETDPNQPGGGTQPSQPSPGGSGSGNNLLNPQTGSYLANQYAANTMFNHKIHDRRYFDTAKQLWGRIDGHFGKFKYAGGDSAKVDYDHYVIQLGGDLFRHAEHPFVVGVMGAYGHTKSKITEHGANGRSYTSKGRGNGYALGVYATYGSVEDFYLDGWIQYVHMSSKVKNEFVANPHREERYKNKGFVASLEAGKLFQATENLYIQPQGQITWMGVKQDSHTGRDGFRVDATKDNVQIRLGARFMGNYQPDGSLNPYAELNYFHNTKPFGVRYDGGRTYEMSGSRNLGQVKVGVNGHLNSDTAMWGEISHAQGRKSYRDTKLSIGIKHEF